MNLALDVCDKQKSRVIKTQGAKLLEAICDNIDGGVSFVTLFSCQSICLALGNGLTNGNVVASIENVSQYFYQQVYSQYLSSNFIAGEGSSKEIIAETCLVALTTISYILPRRTDLVPVFEAVLALNIDPILGLVTVPGSGDQYGSILLRARMSLLLGYYADMLFKKYEDAFLKVIDFLFKSIALHGREKVIAL